MKIKFWGTRGSIPSPLSPEEVEEKICHALLDMPALDTHHLEAIRAYVHGLPPLVRGTAGGNTPCVEVRSDDGELFILDAGTGIRRLGRELMRDADFASGRGVVHLFITHTHWDHIQGFTMFDPTFVAGNKIFIYGLHELRSVFELQQQPATWPVALDYMSADIQFVKLRLGEPLTIGKVRIDTMANTHLGGSYSYRFHDQHSTFIYATDAEYKQLDETSLQPYIEFFHGADALVFDAQYALKEAWQKVDWGHSSAMIGIDLARASNVKHLLLFHHDPNCSDADLEEIRTLADDYQLQDPTRPRCQVSIAQEGLTLDLTPRGAVDLHITPEGAAAILTPTQIFDEVGVNQVAQQLDRLAQAHTTSSIIDLSQVKTLTTASLKALVALRQKQKGGAPIVLAAPSESVRRVAELAGYLDYFAIYPSVEAALAAVQAREGLNLRGQLLKGRYQIERQMGESPLGTVLKTTDTHTNRPVALKILSPAFSEETIDRFMHQTAQAIHLDHPNIVKTLAWEKDGEHAFQVEEYINAPTLEELLKDEGTRPTGEHTMDMAVDIARALEYAHSRGVIHGNLKPANIFVTAEGVKLNGFGLGRLVEGRNLLEAPFLLLAPEYLAPEQILGQPMDARTDLYALGIILYEIFTGQVPFTGLPSEILYAHLRQMPGPPRELNPTLSPSQEHLILKLLAKNPNDRYTSAQQTLRISTSLLTPVEEITQRRVLLVGREPQWRAIRACWEEAIAGRGQLVFLTGEPGIGKTSLAQQVAAQSQPPVLLMGECKDGKVNPPYQLFTDVLRAYFATVPPEFFDHKSRQLLSSFTRLVPEIRQMLPDLPVPASVDPEQEQLRLMTSLTQFIKHATQERPWMIILDGLQWADTSSLEMLRYLSHHLPAMALMIIGIYRDVDLERGNFLLEMLRDLSGHPSYHHFALERLNESDVDQILTHIWKRPVPAEVTHKIYAHTEGNPFYVEEIAQGLIDDGLVTLEEGTWELPDLSTLRLPQSVRQAVWRRIESLRPDTQALLSQAAVLGQSFRFEDLQEMSSLTKWETLEHLDVALERHLVEEVPGETTLRFRHAEIQQVLYADLGPLRRRVLHHQAAEALERRAQPHPEHIAEALIYHFSEAGEFERAIHYSLQAAQQTQEAHANDAAILWYRRTLAMLDKVDANTTLPILDSRIAIHRALGEVLSLIGEYNQALEHYATARSLLKASDYTPEQARLMAELCYGTAKTQESRGDYDSAQQWLDEALTYLDESHPTSEIVRIYNLLGWILVRRGEQEKALAHIEKALALARAGGLHQAEASSLRFLGNAYYHRGDYTHAAAAYTEALALTRETGDLLGESATLNNLGNIAHHLGNYAQARAYHEQSMAIKQAIGDRSGESASLNNLGILAGLLGDYETAYTSYKQALAIKLEIGDRRGESTTLTNLSAVYLYRGEFDPALADCERALTLKQETGDRFGEADALDQLGVIAYHLGAYSRARQYFEQALRIRREIGNRAGESQSLGHLGLTLLRLNQKAMALKMAQMAVELSREVDDRHVTAFNLTFLGHILTELNQQEEALTAYQEALALRETLQQTDLAAEPLAGLARLHLLQGALEQAHAETEILLQYLHHGALEGTYEPLRVYHTCYTALVALNDAPRAREILTTACNLLAERATHIADPLLRQTYLEQVAVHSALRAAFRALPDPHADITTTASS